MDDLKNFGYATLTFEILFIMESIIIIRGGSYSRKFEFSSAFCGLISEPSRDFQSCMFGSEVTQKTLGQVPL